MPRSRVRRKAAYSAPSTRSPRKIHSATWIGPAMLTFFILGIAWLATYYITNGDVVGMRSLGSWNLIVGFAFIMAGFMLSTRWK